MQTRFKQTKLIQSLSFDCSEKDYTVGDKYSDGDG